MRMSLRWKIVGGYGLLLVLIVLLGWVTLSLFGSTRTVQRRVFDDALPGLIEVDEIVRSYTAQSAAVSGYLIQFNESLLEDYRREIEIGNSYERAALQRFRSGTDHELLVELVEAGEAFHQVVDEKVIPHAQEGRRALAFTELGSEGTPLIAEIEVLGEQLRHRQDAVMTKAENDLRRQSNNVIIILTVVTIVTLLIGITLAYVLPRRLTENIARLVNAARGIERGDFDQRVDIRSGDEVEELATRFTEMQSGLKRLQQLALQNHELEIAAAIQRNLLQRSLPENESASVVPVQRQANLVGGDWYDVNLTGATLTVVVGDASGKGIGAALMATVALSVLRAETGLGAPPKRVIERANEALREATDPDSFTTLVYATLDVRSGEVAWLNMGHPSPFVLRADGDPDGMRGYYLEGPRNRALGWFEDPGLAETVIRLNPGDRLVLFTDGFLEAKNPEGEVFGDHRFADALVRYAALPAEELGEELVGDVERFAAGKLDDDLTMLVVDYQGSSIDLDADDQESGDEEWRSKR